MRARAKVLVEINLGGKKRKEMDADTPFAALRSELSSLIREDKTRALLLSLDDEQLGVAVASFTRPLLVSAGPGAGKTRAITARAAAMIAAGAPPSSLCFLSFSKGAAAECAERLAKVLGATRARAVRVRTFHGAALLLWYGGEFSFGG